MQKLSLVSRKYLFWLVLGLFIFIPLYPKFPLFNVKGTYVAIRIEDFLIAIVSICWFIGVLPNIKKLLSQSITQAMLLFWLIGAISLFSGIFLTQTVTPLLGLLHYLRRVEVMVLFFLGVSAISNVKQLKIWLLTMLVVTFIIVLYGFGQQWFAFPVISTTNREFSKGLILRLTPDARVNSTFAGHYDLAAYLGMFLVVSASVFFYLSKFYFKVITIFISVLSFLLLSLTAARVSFFAAIIGIIGDFWLIKQKKFILAIVAFVVLAFAISPELRHRTIATLTVNILGGGGAKYVMPPQASDSGKAFSVENAVTGSATPAGVPVDISPGEPVNPTELGVYRSFGIRFNEEWPRAIRAFEKNPLIGTGYSSITIATDNDYLRSLGEVGLLGTLSLILVFYIPLKSMWQFLRTTSKNLEFYLVTGLFAMTIAILINGLFIDVLESSKVAQIFWMSLGIGVGAIKLKYSK